ncbi:MULTISPECIES: nicotinate phosphoribosyltransferase [Salegentibacter]|jgi:nicotinate phosphoribosyltransferase|uniref:Nicotinate phosphoribosyltransferase n=1 Tax=Salegentibacter agarivorans TaxID=345907 RepID=A0A1I2M7E0_9FLAO|nr:MULTISPECIES: nicotinate phosphoribosyltransferase [Salegentibacter]APS37967.1 nicotinate phosphoribosyltransferase [Salegentibacter sp. T436]SFF87374.1 nicotinate phosphoribosyltransferase [Salegentibacter agarivorans]
MLDFSATYTDQYQLAMSQVYFKKGQKDHTAIFDYYFRKLPYNGGYAIFAGLQDLLKIIENLKFNDKDLEYLKKQDFDDDFLQYLKDFKFHGNIYSVQEGDVVFPTRPILQVEANIIEAQIIETILLNLLNFQTLIATKASRIKLVSGERTLLDFGLRRAQGPGGYYATRAAIIGGFNGTSNVIAGRDFNIPVSGTMAHSFIQSYDDEITAFRDFAEGRPKDCVLLVDTYDTLKSGVPNAITVAKEMEDRGEKLMAIRLDSGDLAYLSKQSRKMLDEAGLDYVKIAASNQLEENVIKSLLEQGARIDVFGVGTNLVIGSPDAALDGVYKLAYSNGKPRIKISESIVKVTLPHKKQVYRLRDTEGNCVGGDLVALFEEDNIKNMIHPFEPYKQMKVDGLEKEALLKPVMENGKNKLEKKSLQEIAEYSKNRLAELSIEYKRFNNPHIYKVGISEALKAERDKLIASFKN